VESAPVVIHEQTNILVPKGKNVVIDQNVAIKESINAPVAKGVKVGEVVYSCEGQEVGRSMLIIQDAIEKATPADIMSRLFDRWLLVPGSK